MNDKPATDSAPQPSTAALWIGRVISLLPCLALFMSAYFKISKHPMAVEGFEKSGFPANVLVPLGIVELACTIIYLIPQTAVLGAILLTGYLGGAICTHVRAGEDWYVQFAFGVVLWIGLYLREPRLRVLAPLRKI